MRHFLLALLSLIILSACQHKQHSPVATTHQQGHYFYDENNVRYTLVSTRGGKAINWIFIPGGPGFDSSGFRSLTDILDLPGNVWLIDLPGNGSHIVKKDDFDAWFKIFVQAVKRFQNPVVVGASWGGMLTLSSPELENILAGCVIMNSSPTLWFEAAFARAKELNLPSFEKEMTEYFKNPNQEAFNAAVNACMPYYFPPHSIERGRILVNNAPFAMKPAMWWQKKAAEMPYNATWVPQQVKTLIIGAEFDAMTPFVLFQKDARFKRDNIKMAFIKDAGHFPWVEQPKEVKRLFDRFTRSLVIE
ncbi:MAG: alpha/beta hydrolase [Pseudomonadota bacterium]